MPRIEQNLHLHRRIETSHPTTKNYFGKLQVLFKFWQLKLEAFFISEKNCT